MQRLLALGVVGIVLLSPACDRGAPPTSPPPTPFVTPSAGGASPTPPALPESPPPTRGASSGTCVNGWRTPRAGTPRATEPIGIIRRTAMFEGPAEIVDMRYFVGPESPPSDKGYLLTVERWYVKLYATADPRYQGRFIVEARLFGRGVAAVAAYDTGGFRSPDWVGFQWDSADTEPKGYPGLPGTWRGIPYDFVRGGAGLAIPGLPAEVGGCLEGT